MNIFFLSLDPQEAAEWHGDKHVIKMILESVQMLTTCVRMMKPEWVDVLAAACGQAPYKPTHANHPCNKWIRERAANFRWLACLAKALCNEKRLRWPQGKPHACEPMVDWFLTHCPLFDDLPMSSAAQAMPDEFKVAEDAVEAYRAYYRHKFSKGIVAYIKTPSREPQWLNLFSM